MGILYNLAEMAFQVWEQHIISDFRLAVVDMGTPEQSSVLKIK